MLGPNPRSNIASAEPSAVHKLSGSSAGAPPTAGEECRCYPGSGRGRSPALHDRSPPPSSQDPAAASPISNRRSSLGHRTPATSDILTSEASVPTDQRKSGERKLFSLLGMPELQAATGSLPSSSDRSSSSAPQMEMREGMESDEEIRRVPDFGSGGASTAGREAAMGRAQPGQKRRGRSPADKEHKRLKRLLRNRVSAQQARERKKAYMTDLESKVKDLEGKNSELEERLSTLQNENQMLRQILKNTTVSRRVSGSSVNGDGIL